MPSSALGKAIAAIWLLAGFGLLLFAYSQRAVHDMPEAFTWLLIALSFPIGLAGAAGVGAAWPVLSTHLGMTYHPFVDILPYWVVIMPLGYVQWFVLLPAGIRRLTKRNA